jgi:hypothetical protein
MPAIPKIPTPLAEAGVQPRLGSGVNDVVLVGQSGHGWLLGIGQGSARHWRAAGAALVRATSVVEAGARVHRWTALGAPGHCRYARVMVGSWSP